MMPGQPQGQPGCYHPADPGAAGPGRPGRGSVNWLCRFALGVTLEVTATATTDRSPA